MQTLCEYLDRTESAARTLFDGIESYREALHGSSVEVFVAPFYESQALDRQLAEWANNHREAIKRQQDTMAAFAAETFSQATLAGAVLQIACAAIERYGVSRQLDSAAKEFLDTSKSQFWSGRLVRGLPLGVVILAGRNQHMHSGDSAFRPATTAAFTRMALSHGVKGFESTPELALDLSRRDPSNPMTRSFAHNVLSLTGWKRPADMREDLLAIAAPSGSSL